MKAMYDDDEVGELRERLREAEETLRAIWKGEVDALVVEGTEGIQVFTLEGADYIYRVFVEAMNEGSTVIAGDGTILHCNAKLASLLKSPLEKTMGSNFYDCIVPERRPVLEGLIHACGTEGLKGEFSLMAQEGPTVPVIISARLCLPETGAYCLVITDLSDQKRLQKELEAEVNIRRKAEEALRELNRALEQRAAEIDAYYSGSPIGLCALDTGLRYLKVNERLALLNGIPPAEHIGRSVRDILKPGMASQVESLVRRVIKTGEPIKGVEFADEVSGAPALKRTYLGTFNPLKDAAGQIRGVTVAVADISEQLRMKEHLRQAEKMEALGSFTAGIAHDFNNILAAILGFAETCLDDVRVGTPLEKNLQNILTASLRGRDLIGQMLAFSRKMPSELRPMSITPLVKETARLLRASIPTTIQIAVDSTASSDTILANPMGIQQIVMNLAANATYAMRNRGGRLSITIADAVTGHPAGFSPGPYLELTVQDTGTGMSESVMERLFEPFFTTKEPGEGTGMGLAVVYGTVKSLKGHITVDSEPDVGSAFRILFPKVVRTETARASKSAAQTEGNKQILLVENEEILADLAKDMLERLGYTVTALRASTEALKLFAEDPSAFDLVIADEGPSEFSGLQLAKKLLELRPDIRIVLSLDQSGTTRREEAQASGIRECLSKPFVREDLAATVRQALGGSEG